MALGSRDCCHRGVLSSWSLGQDAAEEIQASKGKLIDFQDSLLVFYYFGLLLMSHTLFLDEVFMSFFPRMNIKGKPQQSAQQPWKRPWSWTFRNAQLMDLDDPNGCNSRLAGAKLGRFSRDWQSSVALLHLVRRSNDKPRSIWFQTLCTESLLSRCICPLPGKTGEGSAMEVRFFSLSPYSAIRYWLIFTTYLCKQHNMVKVVEF